MLELAILGFLYERGLHGYELRTKVAALTGHVRPIADGTMYPAIKRLERAGLLDRQVQPGLAAAPRHVLSLTSRGRTDFLHRLREPTDLFVSDENRWFTVLAFLRHLDDPASQVAVLRRRLAFLTQPASFFWDGDRPLRAADFDDPFRRGLFTIATATSRTEIRWLRQAIADLTVGEPERHDPCGPGGAAPPCGGVPPEAQQAIRDECTDDES